MIDILKSVRRIVAHLGPYKKSVRLAYLFSFLEICMRFLPYGLTALVLERLMAKTLDETFVHTVGKALIVASLLQVVM